METLKIAKSKLASANKDILSFINAFVDDKSFVETDAFVCSQNVIEDAPGEGVVAGLLPWAIRASAFSRLIPRF